VASIGSLSERLDSLYSISDHLKVVFRSTDETIEGSERGNLTASARH